MWTLAEAQSFIAELEPMVRAQDYHTLLGGGVLHHGMSHKDLDIWLFPLNGYESDPGKMYALLTSGLGLSLQPIRDSPDYKAGEPYYIREMWTGLYFGKRIDFFVR